MAKESWAEQFERILKELEELEEKKKDVIKRPRDIIVSDDGLRIDGLGNVRFTKTGLQTFCSKLDLPSSYMGKLLDTEGKTDYEIRRDREVFKTNIQRGLEMLKEDTEILFRTYDKDGYHLVRGVFSDRYKVIDNLPILQEICRNDFSELKIERFAVDSDYMDIRFTMPNLKRSIGKLPVHEARYDIKEDLVFPAIHLRNSEVGKSRISVQFIVYRQICTNGLVNRRDQYRVIDRKHVGEYDLAQVSERMGGIIGKAQDMFEKYVDAMITSKEIVVDDAEDILKSIGRREGITNRMVETVINNWQIEQRSEKTKHGIIGAITAGARDWERSTKDFTGRLKLEEVAGDILFANVW